MVCWDCGKPDVKIGHPGCTQVGKRLHKPKSMRGSSSSGDGSNNDSTRTTCEPPVDAPKDGESEVRTKDGAEQKYCSRCKS